MGYEKEAYLYSLFHYTGKTDIQESTPKIQMLMFGLAQTSHFNKLGRGPHTKYQGFRPYGFRQENFFMFFPYQPMKNM